MKVKCIIVILCSVAFSVADQQFDPVTAFMNDFTVVSETYYDRMIPFIDSLAEKQFPPLKANASETDRAIRKARVHTIAHVHKTNVRKYINESLEHFKEKNAPTYKESDSEKLVEWFDFGLRMQFLYLDHGFYEETKNVLEKKMKS